MHYLSGRQIVNVIIIICSRHSLCYILSDGSPENHLAADFEGLVFEILYILQCTLTEKQLTKLNDVVMIISMTVMACFFVRNAGLRSSKTGEQCEAIVRFPGLFEKYPFPILINSALLKLADVFRVG